MILYASKYFSNILVYMKVVFDMKSGVPESINTPQRRNVYVALRITGGLVITNETGRLSGRQGRGTAIKSMATNGMGVKTNIP